MNALTLAITALLDGMPDLPVCPECGPITVKVALPTVGDREVRLPCPHQEATFAAEARERGRREAQATYARVHARHLPPRTFTGRSLDDLVDHPGSRQARRIALRFRDTFEDRVAAGEGLLFSGPVGTGKTAVAAALVTDLEAAGWTVAWTTAPELQQALRDLDHGPAYVAALKAADVLALDEFGLERATEYSAAGLFDVIDHRYQARKPILITTNLASSELADHYLRCLVSGRDRMPQGQAELTVQRILSRLRERCVPVKFTGPDLRQALRATWLPQED